MNIIVTDGKDGRFHKLCDQLDEYLDTCRNNVSQPRLS